MYPVVLASFDKSCLNQWRLWLIFANWWFLKSSIISSTFSSWHSNITKNPPFPYLCIHLFLSAWSHEFLFRSTPYDCYDHYLHGGSSCPRRGQWEPSGVLTILPASDSRACVSSAHCPSQILAQYLIYFLMNYRTLIYKVSVIIVTVIGFCKK